MSSQVPVPDERMQHMMTKLKCRRNAGRRSAHVNVFTRHSLR
jgi:hypothetical protein